MARRLPPPAECAWLEAVDLADTLEGLAVELQVLAGEYPAAKGFRARARWRGQLAAINHIRFRAMGYRRRAMELRNAEAW